MIELLKEERAAIINQAVTKGLNPNAEMKDSGIKWLGQIPKHWEIKKLKYLLSDNKGIKIGPFGSSLKAEFITNTGYKVYGQENVITDDFGIGYRYIDENKFAELFNYELFPGDVIITMMGTTGKSKVVPAGISRGVMDSHLLRMRFNCKAAPQYVSFLINDSFYIYTQLKILSKGSIMEGLNSTIVCSLLIALPPKDEQKIILQYLNNKLSEINLILYKEKKGIELLKEYRNTLIPEAVTGKIDVRKNA
jgi:type I restriction enzyme S subunit